MQMIELIAVVTYCMIFCWVHTIINNFHKHLYFINILCDFFKRIWEIWLLPAFVLLLR